ncbi:MAG: helix-turn-helix transcriptional regulator [Proteobacteria bacterium]|nr:XRE family transcriptional regulator [Pseudomonadota bacterium]NOG61302.1 helix-turn-helix transcriptional regulator [Pseudomonadota bacterium]
MDKELKNASEKRLNYGLRRISDRLFYARIKAKLSQEDVAKIRNISVKTVKRWETRAGTPKNQNLIMKLAEIYNISYPWLSFHFGSEETDFEQGFELELIDNIWQKLDREKQKSVMVTIQKLIQ